MPTWTSGGGLRLSCSRTSRQLRSTGKTLKKISAFRNGKTKAEIWLLTSPSMVAKGVAGANGEAFDRRVDTRFMTPRIPMRMPSGLPIYDMVFATDHPVGNKIMTDLYRKTAEREPLMRREAKAKGQAVEGRGLGYPVRGSRDLDPSRVLSVGPHRLLGPPGLLRISPPRAGLHCGEFWLLRSCLQRPALAIVACPYAA